MKQYVNTNTINIAGAVVTVCLSVSLAYAAITKNSSFASKWDYSVSELAKVNSKHCDRGQQPNEQQWQQDVKPDQLQEVIPNSNQQLALC